MVGELNSTSLILTGAKAQGENVRVLSLTIAGSTLKRRARFSYRGGGGGGQLYSHYHGEEPL